MRVMMLSCFDVAFVVVVIVIVVVVVVDNAIDDAMVSFRLQ
jgi:hypothetical protein